MRYRKLIRTRVRFPAPPLKTRDERREKLVSRLSSLVSRLSPVPSIFGDAYSPLRPTPSDNHDPPRRIAHRRLRLAAGQGESRHDRVSRIGERLRRGGNGADA